MSLEFGVGKIDPGRIHFTYSHVEPRPVWSCPGVDRALHLMQSVDRHRHRPELCTRPSLPILFRILHRIHLQGCCVVVKQSLDRLAQAQPYPSEKVELSIADRDDLPPIVMVLRAHALGKRLSLDHVGEWHKDSVWDGPTATPVFNFEHVTIGATSDERHQLRRVMDQPVDLGVFTFYFIHLLCFPIAQIVAATATAATATNQNRVRMT